MEALIIPLEILGAIALLALLAALFFAVRHYLLTRGAATFDCSLRTVVEQRPSAWMLGVARYESDRLDWFRIFALKPRPGRSLDRHRLSILERRLPDDEERQAVLPGSVIVRCALGSATVELAMAESAYDGFATWLESAPPGQQPVQVA